SDDSSNTTIWFVAIGVIILIAIVAWAVGRGSSTTTTTETVPPPPAAPPVDEGDAYDGPANGESGA
ncbi:MAG: hypothetical protein WBO25_09915, partial [Acidimicrobiia bacterium]